MPHSRKVALALSGAAAERFAIPLRVDVHSDERVGAVAQPGHQLRGQGRLGDHPITQYGGGVRRGTSAGDRSDRAPCQRAG